MNISSKNFRCINIICCFPMLVNCMELSKNKDFSNNNIDCYAKKNMIGENNTFNNLKENSIKNVLVVSTKSFENIENAISKAEEALFSFNKNIEYKFYVIQEMYQGERPKNVKYENYIFTSDSGDPQELNRIVTEVSKLGTSFNYNIQTMNYFLLKSIQDFRGLQDI